MFIAIYLFAMLPLIFSSLHKDVKHGSLFIFRLLSRHSKMTVGNLWRRSEPIKKPTNTIKVWEGMTIKDLSEASKRPAVNILSVLNSGILKSRTARLNSKMEDRNLITSLVHLLGFKPIFQGSTAPKEVNKDAFPRPPAAPDDCVSRPPVVAVLGHVDHGKTTLLDALRATRTVDAEFGGITQHLAAFTVSLSTVALQAGMTDISTNLFDILSTHITFLDTPGHAAFAAIRARGAAVTDIVVLVVAADDGVMPQTVESIRFAKEANTPIVVAINKVDKPKADVHHVIHGLATHGVLVEQLGGDVQAVEISALKRLHLHNLLEAICLQAELMQLKAEPSGPCEGVILEATVDSDGRVATCLVTRGQLQRKPHSGPLVAGEAICSPRMLFDDRGQPVSSVGPGYVAKIAGWKDLPPAGAVMLELPTMARAAEVVRFRCATRMRQWTVSGHTENTASLHGHYGSSLGDRTTLSRMASEKQSKCSAVLENPVITFTGDDPISCALLIKTDTHGALDAIKKLLSTCPSDQCTLQLVQPDVGPLTESEAQKAAVTKATVLLFNIDPLPGAREWANTNGVTIQQYNVIYRLAEDVHALIESRLPPRIVERIVGEAEILALFVTREARGGGKPLRVPVAGCRCTKGHLLASQATLRYLPDSESYQDAVAMFYRVIRPARSSSLGSTSSDHDGDESVTAAEVPTMGSVLADRATCRSLRHERTSVASIRKGVECGIVLTDPESSNTTSSRSKKGDDITTTAAEKLVSNWQVGDRIQCYVLVKEPRHFEWQFDAKPVDSVVSNQ